MYSAAVSTHRTLLGTKLFIPPPRARLVARPRLTHTLDDALRRNHKLILLAAPAGFGKTTILSGWLTALPSSLAWLSLDAADNDLARFLSYLIAAFEKLDSSQEPWDELFEIARTAADQNQSPQQILTLLLNRLNVDESTRILVLDDYHVIDAGPIHDALTFLIERLPPHYHIVMTTRADPSLPLARLRARAQLTELRARDLRFTADEAAAFLNETMGLQLSASQMAALEARTEGWIAGLQLAALALQSQNSAAGPREVDSFISAFAGSNRYIMDYLAEEVLASQPESIQQFLLHTCILERLSGSLCDAVIERADSQTLLEQLERLNLFVTPLDDVREWYRYHHLFADLLRHHLAQAQGQDFVAELHRRASRWFERQSLGGEAIHHALSARDFERAAELIEQNAESFQKSGEYLTLQGWLEQFPTEIRRVHPALGLLNASILLTIHDLQGAQAPLKEVEASLGPPEESPQIWAELLLHQARLAHRSNEHQKEMELAERGLSILPPGNPMLEGRLLLAKGNGAYYVMAPEISLGAFIRAAQLAHESGDLPTAFNALSNQLIIHILMGHLQLAVQVANQSFALAEGLPAPHLLRIGAFYTLLGAVRYEWNQLAPARQSLEQAIELADRSYDPYWMMLARVWLGRTLMMLGDTLAAADMLTRGRQIADKYHFPPMTKVEIVPHEIQLWLLQGNPGAMADWVRSSGIGIKDTLSTVQEPEHIAFARALILLNEPSQALEFLERLEAAARARGANGMLVPILVLQACAHYARSDMTLAWQALWSALTLARPGGYVRTFVDEGAPMQALLTDLARELRANRRGRLPTRILDNSGDNLPQLLLGYVNELLAAFGDDHKPSAATVPLPNAHIPSTPAASAPRIQPIEPLTDREIQVLKLIASGHSNQEIARILVVEPGTVKKHINNLYGKLGVNSRTQAARRARELGLDG